MADVSFDEEKAYAVRSVPAGSSTNLLGTLKKLGVAKTDTEAQYILLGLAGVTVVAAIIVAVVAFGGSSKPVDLPPVPAGTRLPVSR